MVGSTDKRNHTTDNHGCRDSPRRSKSSWSKKNTEHAQRLIASGEMAPTGMKEVEAAKTDGRWSAAYEAFGKATVPEDFLRSLPGTKKRTLFSKR